MPLRNLVWLLIIPGLVGLGLAVCYSAPRPDRDYQRVRQMVEVLAEVEANYVRELSEDEKQQLVEDMISLGLKKLDPNSEYFNEQQLRKFETDNEGSYAGVGITLGIDPASKLPRVGSVMGGGPAYEAGVAANDTLVKVGDTPAQGMTIEHLVGLIKGEVGTPVTLTFRREGRAPPEFAVTLTRGRIPVHSVAGVSRRADDPTKWNWFIDPGTKIALIRIQNQFNELTAKEVKEAVEEAEAAGARGLILDLRDNPGGLLNQAIEVADLFLTDGKIVTTVDRRGNEKTSSAREKGTLFLPADQKPIVVLVNGGSASASEIVASALQDNGRAVVVGERTYGKGSVQSLLRLPPDQKTAVKLTTQAYRRPSGKNIDRNAAPRETPDEWGVRPDHGLAVPTTPLERLRYQYEMEKLRFLPGRPDAVGKNPPRFPEPVPTGHDGKPLWTESQEDYNANDQQLQRALDHLRNKLRGLGAAPPPAPVRIPA